MRLAFLAFLLLLALLLASSGGLRAPTAAPRATEYPRPAVTVVLGPGYEGPTVAPYPAPDATATPTPTPLSDVGKVPEAPFVTVQWRSRTQVRIEWEGGNLYRLGTDGQKCYLASPRGTIVLPWADACYHPEAGDVYVVRDVLSGDVVAEAQLRSRGWLALPVLFK